MSTEIPPPGRPLVSRPGGVITRRQALATGLPATTVESWVQRGRWTRLARGIYATSGGPPSREALLWAALLRVVRGLTTPRQLSRSTAGRARLHWRAEIGAALTALSTLTAPGHTGRPEPPGAAPPPAEGARAVGCRPVQVMKAGHARNLLAPARGAQRQAHHGAPGEPAGPRRPSWPED